MKKEMNYICPALKYVRLRERVSVCNVSGGYYNPEEGEYDEDSD